MCCWINNKKKMVKKLKSNSKVNDIVAYIFKETKLLNLYKVAEIRFNNISTNDTIVKSKLNKMYELGWTLFAISSAVGSSGHKDPNRVFFN